MARQHLHNRRAARGSTGGGASWISYSDMMAALLLIFVLILCYSLYQYFTMLEQKSAELENQRILLISQQADLDEKEQTLIIIKADLDDLESRLTLKEAELDEANNALILREEELAGLQVQLTAKQTELDNAMLRLAEQQEALDAQAARIDELVGVRGDIIRELSTALTSADLNAFVDPNTGDIMLDSAIFFEYNSSVITPAGKDFLDRFVPVYLDVLLQDRYSDFLGEIIIEGHTDSSGSYEHNLKISQDRARAVAEYCLNMEGLSSAQRRKLQQVLTVSGRSWSDLKYDANGNEDAQASRRVEIKFSLKDAEMINEMEHILHPD